MELEMDATWRRGHRNRWTYVVYEGKGRVHDSVRDESGHLPSRGAAHVAGLLRDVQVLADGRIPAHPCDCPEWTRLTDAGGHHG